MQVQPRPTPEERAGDEIQVEVDEAIAVHVEIIEDWTAPRQNWEFIAREGHDFGRANNVEGELLFVAFPIVSPRASRIVPSSASST